MGLPTQMVHLTLSKETLEIIDTLTIPNFMNRSEFIRQAIAEKLRQTTTNAFPDANGLNILMTDVQLEELFEVLLVERRRRKRRGWRI